MTEQWMRPGKNALARKERRDRIAEFVRGFWEREGYGPSVAEIAEAVGHATSTVGMDLSWLVWRGELERFQTMRGWRCPR